MKLELVQNTPHHKKSESYHKYFLFYEWPILMRNTAIIVDVRKQIDESVGSKILTTDGKGFS